MVNRQTVHCSHATFAGGAYFYTKEHLTADYRGLHTMVDVRSERSIQYSSGMALPFSKIAACRRRRAKYLHGEDYPQTTDCTTATRGMRCRGGCITGRVLHAV